MIAFITGSTSGIGQATAELFAENNVDLVICGRRKERLEERAARLRTKVRVHTLSFDVRDNEAVRTAVSSLPEDFRTIDILINNAGNAHGLDPIDTANVDDWDAMIDINVKGLLYVTKALVPGMVTRRSGHIINVGSLAGKEVYPLGNVYAASKHAVDALSKGMRLDLHAHGIRVGAVHPGLVETEFSEVRFKGDTARAAKVYEGYQPLTARDVAEVIWFMVSRPAHVNVSDVLVLPSAQASATVVSKA